MTRPGTDSAVMTAANTVMHVRTAFACGDIRIREEAA